MRKTIRKLHLWLGMLTGPIVFIVALTGAIYAFQEEIQNATQDFRFVETQKKKYLPPSELISSADKVNPGRDVHAVMYQSAGKSAKVIYYNFKKGYYDFVYVNPYSSQVLKVYDVKNSFFGWILAGHFNLWLPMGVGSIIVASTTLIFAFIVISGLILWWPKNKNNKRQNFTIKRKTRWRRRNFDLHRVLGFYSLLFALLFAFTGLIWGFSWFKNLVYSSVSLGKEYVQYSEPESQTLDGNSTFPIDKVWSKMNQKYPNAEWIEIHMPHDNKHSIAANANPDATTYWKTDYVYFDQKTLQTIPVKHHYGKLSEATPADTIMRINYDTHVGGILGLPGKIIMCLFSLVIASLPITGILIWYGRKKKKARS